MTSVAFDRQLLQAVIQRRYFRVNWLVSDANIRNLRGYFERLAREGKIDDAELALAVAGVEWRTRVTKRFVMPLLLMIGVAAFILEWKTNGPWTAIGTGGCGALVALGYRASMRDTSRRQRAPRSTRRPNEP